MNESLKRRITRNRKFIAEYLKDRSCITCSEDDPIVLEFDHVRNKKYKIADIVGKGYALSTIQAEIANCNVLCANCHRRKTSKQLNHWKQRYKRRTK